MFITRVLLSCVLFTLLCDNICGDEEEKLVVEAPSGTYRGHILKTRNGRNVRAFQGIPYAKPPVGELRFKDPEALDKLEGVYKATDESRECIQPTFNMTDLSLPWGYKGTEDCLLLNVYVPQVERQELMPVFFWIHGGSYFMASGSTFYNGPEYLLDKDMIFVTVNYRLGILGFLSTGDKVISGNMGMKDQRMALKWVQDNIRSFGGDSGSVTIGGESAGGGAVSQHMHSHLSKGFFHRAISMSGTIHGLWSTVRRTEARKVALQVADHLGCSFEPEYFVRCLQKMPIEHLSKAFNTVMNVMGILSMKFVPVIEEDSPSAFLTETSMKAGANVPFMVGATNGEAIGIVRFLSSVNPKYKDFSKVYEDLDQLMPVTGYYSHFPNSKEITEKLKELYFKGRTGENDDDIVRSVNYFGDMMFYQPTIQAARSNKARTFLYLFSYKGERTNVPVRPKALQDGVNHAEDLMYLFDFKYIPREKEMNREDSEMSEEMVQLWYNFIRHGDPTPDSKVWKESERGHKYLDITNKGRLIMKSDLFKSRMDILDRLIVDERFSVAQPHEEL